MPRVILSSGHTAANPGVIANGLQEFEVARKIAKAALKYIRLNGLISLSTPPNLELAQRIDWINKTGYTKATNDLAIEIHINDGGKRGIEGWYEGEGNSPSLELTSRIVETICSETNFPNVGIKSEFEHELGSISFLHEVYPISSIIECGYIDNLEDAEFLKQEKNLDALGKGIAKGILKFFNLEFRDPAIQNTVPSPNEFKPQQINVQQPAPEPAPVTTPYNTNLDTQTDDYDKDDFDPDLDDEDDFGLTNNVPTKPVTPVVNNFVQPQAYTQAPNYVNPAPVNNLNPTPTNYTPLPSREERKQMIINNYTKILGREPNQNDLNYFLNIGIREDELIKKMIDSQEHVDLVKSKQELIELKTNYTKQQNELIELKSSSDDTKNIIENLHSSIDQKNIALTKLQYDIRLLEQKLVEKPKISQSSPGKKYSGSFIDKLFKAMSDILE